LAGAAVLGLVGAGSCTPPSSESPPGGGRAVSGGKAPDFTRPALDGDAVQLSRYAGRVVLLDFWATWCGPCRAEIPHLKRVREAYAGRGFEVIGVSLDDAGPEAVRAFVAREAIPYPVVLGDLELAELYGGIEVIPTAFLIDREGRIVERFIGYKAESALRARIEPLL
jgi:peroxiredoxin